MKKLITGVLAMLACFACFTGCNFEFKQPLDSNQQNSSVEETSNPLDDAAAYLEEMYRVSHKETRKDYEVVSEVLGFAVTWSVDVTTAVTVEQGSGTAMTKIVINKTLEADTEYVLTATLTDAEGNTRTVSFNRKALAALATVPQIVETAPVEGTAYKYYVYQSTKDLDLYFAGDMDGYYFLTTENYEEAADLYVEYVEGSDTTFNVYFNHAEDGKQYIGVKLSDDGAHDNIVYAATPPSSFVWNEELGTITTHLEVTKNDADGNPGKPADYYLGNYSTHVTISASKLSYAGGNGNNVGKLVVLVDKSSIPAETKIATVKDTIDVQTTHKVDKEIELKTTNDLYPEVAITWSVEGEGAVLTDNKLALTIPEQAATVTLTATFTCGEATDTKVFTLTLGPSIPTPTTQEEIVNAAYSLAENEELPGEAYTLTGVITKVNTAFSADYNNVTVTIVVGDMTDKAIECFRLKGEGADVIKVGDTITVTGKLKNYNGKVEFDSGCTLDSYVAGEGGEVTPPAGELTAVVPEAGKAYLFGMTQKNLENKVYYLAGGMDGYYMATTENASEAIETYIEETTGGYYFYTYVDGVKTYINMVVSGTHVNGAYEATASTVYTIDTANKTLVAVVNGADYWFGTRNDKTYTTMGPCAVSYAGFFGEFYAYVEGGEGGGEVETPSEAEEILNALYALADGESLTGEYILTGKITALDSYNNPTIVVEGFEDKPVYCYKLVVDKAIGDTITVKATSMKNYMGTYEFMNCTLVSGGGEGGGEVTPPEGGETPSTPSASISIVDYAAENNWADSTLYSEIKANGFTVAVSGTPVSSYGQNTGKFYESDNTWRIYQNENPSIVITANEGLTIASVKITYIIGKTGILTLNGEHIASETVVTVNGTSITFSVANTGTATNGQVKITAIDVVFANGEGGEVTPPAACEHDYVEGVCSKCGEKDPNYTPEGGETPAPHEHSYTTAVTAPTCTEAGYTTYTCECGDTYKADEVAATGHTYVEGKCACGAEDPEYVAPHVHSYTAVVTAPTCTEKGYTTYTCECNDSYTADEVAATGHTGEAEDYKCDVCSAVVEPAKDSALTVAQAIALGKALGADKYTTNKYYMTVIIESVYNTQYGNANVVDANGDKYVIYGMYSFDGKTRYDALSYKPVAGDEITVYGIIGTYKTDGYQMKSGWLDEVVAHEHVYTPVVTAPTCTAEGYTTHTCSICDDSYIDGETPATGHTTDNGVCENCGQTIGGDAVISEYVKVTSADEFTSGTYVLIVNSKNVTLSTLDGSWIKGSTLNAGNTIDKATGDALAITLEVSDSGVKIKIGTQYVKPKSGNNNGILTGSYDWAYEFQEDGTIVFKGVGSDTTTLAYNVQNSGFRAYKNSTASSYPCYFTAYKLVG